MTAEVVEVVPYDAEWPALFKEEAVHLLDCLPEGLVTRIEHFGSTAVPGLAAKPIVDMLIEVTSLEAANERIVPILEAQGYDYFWRSALGENEPPFYAWFIKRGPAGERTHHLHMVESDSELWERLLFRDYLIDHPQVAHEYAELKAGLSAHHQSDRVAYTKAKGDFVRRFTEEAKARYGR